MNARSAWKTLGIAPTEDKRAIKRAYAAKLKATDVEGDPRAFIALREALETATWEADYLQYQDRVDEPEPEPDAVPTDLEPIRDEEIVVAEPETALEPVNDEPEDDPSYWRWEPQRQPETEADQERIVELLWGEAPTQEIEVELAERTHRILTAPQMEQIDHASAIEDWMASIIAQAIPRSDTMARIAVPHFGWEEHADDWRQRYGVSAAAARLRDLEALDRLMRPDHRWYQAFQLLRQPPPDANNWKSVARHRPEVLALLESIRHHTPALEHELDADHVAQWEPALAADSQGAVTEKKGWGFRWWWWVLIGLWAFVQFARAIDDPAPPPAVAPPAIEADYARWRAEQLPDVRKWMDDNRDVVDRLFAEQRAKGTGLPSCSALDAVSELTKAQFDHCQEAELKRLPEPPQILRAPNPVAIAPAPQTTSRMVYSSPLWRSEQAPRVQGWMDSHPDELDRLLRPHVKAGGLPDCAKLATAAGMSANEMAQCRIAQARRITERLVSGQNPDVPPPARAPPPAAAAAPKPVERAEFCNRPEFSGQPICQPADAPPLPAN